MSYVSAFIRRWYKFQDFFPTQLPVGLSDFNNWCDRLLFTYFPTEASPPSQDSFRFAIAAMVMHLDSQKSKVDNRFFGKAIVKGASNEVASFVMHDLKEKREALIKAQQEALKASQQAEVSALIAGTPDEQLQGIQETPS